MRRDVLARPIWGERIETNVSWHPERRGDHGDFSPTSLGRLGRSSPRNRKIVGAWSEKFGKTLVFACNIDHAVSLAALFQAAGVSAEALHNHMTTDERRAALDKFRKSKTRVLVNVAMLTHGVDIPDIETIFLARPTASKILFSQMVGRGARRTEDKETFRIVDFVDNLKNHGDVLIKSPAFFAEAGLERPSATTATTRKSRGPRLARHEYVPAPMMHFPVKAGYEELAGLEFHSRQTFGIEFEFTRDDFRQDEKPSDWAKVANDLLAAVRKQTENAAKKPIADNGGEKNNEEWNVEFDGSCGWEITSRILRGLDGVEEVVDILGAVQAVTAQHGLKLDARTGTHVHLSWLPAPDRLLSLMELTAAYEPALLSLVSPSRANNHYCGSIRDAIAELRALRGELQWEHHFAPHDTRYLAVNPQNLFDGSGKGYGTVEVRLHNGTQEPLKILVWLSLWMRMVDAVDRGLRLTWTGRPTGDPLSAGPDGDVLQLADMICAGSALRQRLQSRREFVVSRSWEQDPRYQARAREALEGWRRLRVAAVAVSG